jgi:Ala-tRNA(Pro) deacylase
MVAHVKAALRRAALPALPAAIAHVADDRAQGEEEVMIPAKLIEFLDREKTPYVVITHSPAYTAQCIAGLAHIPGSELAKVVMVKVNGELAMAVLPAMYRADLQLLKNAAGAENVILAGEEDFYPRFPECETGAMPPFGNLYGMTTYADESLGQHMEIAFNAGTHRELLRIGWHDFVRLAQPKVLRFAAGRTAQAA